MGFEVKVLADSIAPCGKRLITQLWRYPRPIHSEIMTHKMYSKNSASSRAIPTERLIQMILDDPWIPDYIGVNQKGMAPGEELTDEKRQQAVEAWIAARDAAVTQARVMLALGVHKGVVNRLLEPWMWITIIISATELPNLYALRLDKMAEPHFQHLTRMSKVAIDASTPKVLRAGQWHLPLVDLDEDWPAAFRLLFGDRPVEGTPQDVTETNKHVFELLKKVSVGRCARVSYLTHDGRRDLKEDVALHDRLVVARPLHASPAEHVAQAMDWPDWWKNDRDRLALEGSRLEDLLSLYQRYSSNTIDRIEHRDDLNILAQLLMEMQSGNFFGWRQYRKMLPHENITSWDDVPKIIT